MKDTRRTHEKYKSGYAASVILHLTTGTIDDLLSWLELHLAPYEKIEIESWIEMLFYVVVVDTRMGWPSVFENRAGFTVDIGNDTILWNCDRYDPDTEHPHGNCFVRSKKWKALLAKNWPVLKDCVRRGEHVHWYATVNHKH